ncbi:MAG TPA: branched-chain amino acid ABC transporter permease [Syntrophales bacterium]|nr:branched-chain amino acid ABC transporter permease [Syntrophales bacterium]HPX10872.1 branched-chain amino acid ABC transporter permease [Syntrophales bacterium]HQB30524.1 branched-chain amino acid ABC transporter permease [Syntrophales bacterium]HQN79059.1 branched-chain amino acid ABC transporter permease [Syntrophales bacterium]HQQ28232.1 branched-chain amino acid ABC transporter permease [Syntrophales bacterium]
MDEHRRRNQIFSIIAVACLFLFLLSMHFYADDYQIRILNNIALFIILAVSYNLINGVTGQFSLEPNAFVAIGAYTSALLTLTPAEKQMAFIIEPIIWPLSVIHVPFFVSLIAAGVVTAFFGFLMGFPVFRVRGDYLAIVTLGFGEVVRVVANNTQTITNGPLGLKGLANYTNIWWSWGIAAFTVFYIARLVRSSYGMAMKAVKYDEAAAESIGINAFKHKMLAFTTSAFFEGIGGGLLAHLITTISPTLFTFFLTFNLLIMIVAGGLGSITGSVIAAVVITWGGEALRVVEEPINLGFVTIPGIPGMRMVLFSLILVLVMIFARQGLMGTREFNWNGLFRKIRAWTHRTAKES